MKNSNFYIPFTYINWKLYFLQQSLEGPSSIGTNKSHTYHTSLLGEQSLNKRERKQERKKQNEYQGTEKALLVDESSIKSFALLNDFIFI